MTDAPKRPRGRPQVHATPEAAVEANRVNTAARGRARRLSHVVKQVALTPEVAARADQLIARRGLRGYAALVTQLVDEAHQRDT